ncbi:hypothetical protein DLM78_07105 [Leptospira stimsonii]|uniref:Uncharacterized protein n=1 Tax=Leptospira stimsonii TaxID=2202203 RepID=A0A8B3CTU0_9LEPT|nr:hypothetical protein DLM78_07105 [Leptospira stimsonii]
MGSLRRDLPFGYKNRIFLIYNSVDSNCKAGSDFASVSEKLETVPESEPGKRIRETILKIPVETSKSLDSSKTLS